jgi:exo-1,4-beta-D-glucosaminidase
MKINASILGLIFLSCIVVFVSCKKSGSDLSQKIMLKDEWTVQSNVKVGKSGADITSATFNAASWYHATVPSTVMSTLMKNGLYKDIFLGTNIKDVDKEQFNSSWWYRKEFDLPALKDDQFIQLHFDGVSYYANVWLNGKQVASRDSIFGSFRNFTFDITKFVTKGKNVLAVEIFRQQPGDFGIGFADWNPRPPDENMGLWREVYLNVTGAVSIQHSSVESKVNLETLNEASLTIKTDLTNYSDESVKGVLKGKIDSLEFRFETELQPHELKSIVLTEKEIPGLHMINPKLWWCVGLGDPNLYNLKLSFEIESAVSDASDTKFGIRQIENYFTAKSYQGFKLNGKKVLIKGGGWTDDIFLGDTEKSNEIQVQYVKHMNLNTIRLESFWGSSHNLYELCDKYGIMIMVGWSCQWEWENYLGKKCGDFGGIETEKEMDLIVTSLDDQIKWLRNHPSIITWFVGSDKLPKPELEQRYKKLIAQIDDRPYVAAAANHKSTISGPTGMKMNGPYEYEGPIYWYVDSIHGGAFGFNTETGPGPQVPVKESILKMIPQDKLWPLNDAWNAHCTKATEAFNKLDDFNKAVEGRYGKSKDLDEYILKSGVTQYEAIRPMFEAFRVNQANTTGIVQWMLNSAWPSFYWQLYDYYLLPTSAYYGTLKGNAPLQLIYHYGDKNIYAVNETYKEQKNLKAKVQMYNTDSKLIFEKDVPVDLATVDSKKILPLEKIKGVVFLSLTLLDKENTVVASNFYWLSDKADEFAWDKTTWAYTPMKSYADFKALNSLPKHDLKFSYTKTEEKNEVIVSVTLTNNKDIAFFTNISLVDNEGIVIRPVFWDDNYFSLLPGELKTINCRMSKSLLPADAKVIVSGWNVETQQYDIH